jgi:hypothetical protein
MASDNFIGLGYPLQKTPRGILAQKKGIELIKGNLIQLLLTNPGERVMLPTFGTPLRKLFFEPNDAIISQTAQKMIADSISAFEPRIIIQAIEVSTGSDIDTKSLNPADDRSNLDSVLFIKIKFFDPDEIQVLEELVLEVPSGSLASQNSPGTL